MKEVNSAIVSWKENDRNLLTPFAIIWNIYQSVCSVDIPEFIGLVVLCDMYTLLFTLSYKELNMEYKNPYICRVYTSISHVTHNIHDVCWHEYWNIRNYITFLDGPGIFLAYPNTYWSLYGPYTSLYLPIQLRIPTVYASRKGPYTVLLNDTGILEEKKNSKCSRPNRSRSYDLPISTSGVLPLSYRWHVAGKLGCLTRSIVTNFPRTAWMTMFNERDVFAKRWSKWKWWMLSLKVFSIHRIHRRKAWIY